jgi:hypothetical protein
MYSQYFSMSVVITCPFFSPYYDSSPCAESHMSNIPNASHHMDKKTHIFLAHRILICHREPGQISATHAVVTNPSQPHICHLVRTSLAHPLLSFFSRSSRHRWLQIARDSEPRRHIQQRDKAIVPAKLYHRRASRLERRGRWSVGACNGDGVERDAACWVVQCCGTINDAGGFAGDVFFHAALGGWCGCG